MEKVAIKRRRKREQWFYKGRLVRMRPYPNEIINDPLFIQSLGLSPFPEYMVLVCDGGIFAHTHMDAPDIFEVDYAIRKEIVALWIEGYLPPLPLWRKVLTWINPENWLTLWRS